MDFRLWPIKFQLALCLFLEFVMIKSIALIELIILDNMIVTYGVLFHCDNLVTHPINKNINFCHLILLSIHPSTSY